MNSLSPYIQTLFRHRKQVLFWLILVSAVLVRLYLLHTVQENDFLHNDGHEYLEISKQLANGNGFSLSFYRWYEFPRPGQTNLLHADLSRSPFFPLLGAVAYLLPGHLIPWLKGISLILSLLAIYGVYLLGREIAGATCGLFSAFLFSIYPYELYYTISWSTENLFLLLLAFALLFFLRMYKKLIPYSPLCALFLALATLTRPTAFPLAFGALAMTVFLSMKTSRSWKETGKQAALFLGVFLLILFPWALRNYRVGGSFTPMNYYGNYMLWVSSSDIIYETYRTRDTPDYEKVTGALWKGLHEQRVAELKKMGCYDFVQASRYWKKWALDYIRENPDRMAYILKERFFHYWQMCPNLIVVSPLQIHLLRIFFTGLFFLAVAGLFLVRKSREALVLLSMPVYGLLISIPFLVLLRYRYPFFAPYVCILAALALTWLTTKITGGEPQEPFSAGKKARTPSIK